MEAADVLQLPGAVKVASRPADVDFQRRLYEGGFYRKLRRLRWAFRYDCRLRVVLAEQVFARHGIAFEHQKVFELGFGTGYLLLRFDPSCIIHGCELSLEAIRQLEKNPLVSAYREVRLLQAGPDGEPIFPSEGYDVVMASHVLEHLPDDRRALEELSRHTRPGGVGLFFVPWERPQSARPHHARTYTEAGLAALLQACGWQPLEISSSMRFDYHLDLGMVLAGKYLPPLGSVMEGLMNFFFSLLPAPGMLLADRLLERLFVPARQLTALARRL